MPQLINVPNYGMVEFPDGMSDNDIVDAIKRSAMDYAKPAKVDPYKQTAQSDSTIDNLLAGVGGAMKGLYLGGKQLLGKADQAEIADHRAAMSGLRSTTAGTIGEIAGTAVPAAAAALVPGANTYIGAALTGAGLNGLQPLATDDNRAWEAAKGAGFGLLGQGVANVAGRVVKPVQAVQTPTDTALVQKAKDMGMNLSAAQETGSKPLRWIDSALDNLPYTAGQQAARKADQRAIWQRAALKQAGADADAATTDVMGQAKQRLGDTFNSLSAKTQNVALGDDFLNAISAIDAKKTPFSVGVDSVIDKALELAAQGKISGREYQNVRTSLTNASKGAWASNPELGQALKSLRGALDDAAESSLAPADRALWGEARAQYQALKTIQKAVDPTTGAISPKKLVNELGRSNPNGMVYGQGDQTMPNIARVGKQFIAETLPDSGTAQRSWYMNMLQNPTAGIGGLLGFLHGGPAGAVVGTAAGAATPLAMQRALWSGGRYLRRGLLDPEVAQNVTRPLVMAAPIGLLSELGK